MIVSNTNDLLNILIPNDNKVLKDVLKEADLKTLLGSSKQEVDIPNIIKNLFNDVIDKNKSSQTINNLLQNSNIVKDLGSFTSSVQNVVQTLPADEKFTEVKTFLQKFLVNVENMDDKSLKQQIVKSGIFLESKIDHAVNPNKALQTILEDVKQVIKDVNTPLSKEISTLVDKVLGFIKEASLKPSSNILVAQENKTDLGKIQDLLNKVSTNSENNPKLNEKISSLVSSLQNNSKVSENIQVNSKSFQTEALKTQITSNATTLLSTIKNELQTLSSSLQVATQTSSFKEDSKLELKTSASLNNINKAEEVKSTNTLNSSALNTKTLEASSLNTNSLNNNTTSLTSANYNNLNTVNNVNTTNVSSTNDVSSLNTQTSKVSSLNTQALNTSSNETIKAVINEIDNLVKNKAFFKTDQTSLQPKEVLNNIVQLVKAEAKLQNNQTLNLNTNQALNNLQNILGEIKTSENSLLNDKTLQVPLNDTSKSLQNNLSLLKEGLSLSHPSKTVDTLINKLSNINNLFAKINLDENTMNNTLKDVNPSTFTSNFNNNINSIITTVKSIFVENNNVFNEKNISSLLTKLELVVEAKLKTNIDVNSFLKNDMKASLLLVQAELSTLNTQSESLKHVDKLLTQIDYHQLLSINNNSNHVYLPFLWDLLENGSISVKETKEKKFFCEINLSLKEFGQVNLLLSLYDKNHLDISAFASNNNFKELVEENMSDLRSSLSKAGLVPINIKILDLQKEEKTKDEQQVNQYASSSENLDFKVDIRV